MKQLLATALVVEELGSMQGSERAADAAPSVATERIKLCNSKKLVIS